MELKCPPFVDDGAAFLIDMERKRHFLALSFDCDFKWAGTRDLFYYPQLVNNSIFTALFMIVILHMQFFIMVSYSMITIL